MQTKTPFDPTTRSASSWSSRLAAFKSRGVSDTDPRVAECQSALAFWRMKRQLDTELRNDRISSSFHAAVVGKLLEIDQTRGAAAQ